MKGTWKEGSKEIFRHITRDDAAKSGAAPPESKPQIRLAIEVRAKYGSEW
jgi:hypothetical protein